MPIQAYNRQHALLTLRWVPLEVNEMVLEEAITVVLFHCDVEVRELLRHRRTYMYIDGRGSGACVTSTKHF